MIIDYFIKYCEYYMILGEITNFPKVNFAKMSTCQKHQSKPFGHFMFELFLVSLILGKLTFW